MNHHKISTRASAAFCLLVLCTAASFAQPETRATQVGPSYDVSLHLVIGSDDAADGQLPPSLSGIAKHIKSNFAFSSYRLASTFVGRVSNEGNFEYKSLSNVFGKESEALPQSFLDWSIAQLRNMPTTKGTPGFEAKAFRFGMRVPVPVGNPRGDAGTAAPAFHYESIGVGLVKLGLPENTPTLIGTLNLPGQRGVVFLVMTVRPTDM